MATIATLAVALTADASGFASGANAGRQSMQGLSSTVEQTGSTWKRTSQGMNEDSHAVEGGFLGIGKAARAAQLEARQSGEKAVESLLKGGGVLAIYGYLGEKAAAFAEQISKGDEAIRSGKLSAEDFVHQLVAGIPVIGGIVDAGLKVADSFSAGALHAREMGEMLKYAAEQAVLLQKTREQENTLAAGDDPTKKAIAAAKAKRDAIIAANDVTLRKAEDETMPGFFSTDRENQLAKNNLTVVQGITRHSNALAQQQFSVEQAKALEDQKRSQAEISIRDDKDIAHQKLEENIAAHEAAGDMLGAAKLKIIDKTNNAVAKYKEEAERNLKTDEGNPALQAKVRDDLETKISLAQKAQEREFEAAEATYNKKESKTEQHLTKEQAQFAEHEEKLEAARQKGIDRMAEIEDRLTAMRTEKANKRREIDFTLGRESQSAVEGALELAARSGDKQAADQLKKMKLQDQINEKSKVYNDILANTAATEQQKAEARAALEKLPALLGAEEDVQDLLDKRSKQSQGSFKEFNSAYFNPAFTSQGDKDKELKAHTDLLKQIAENTRKPVAAMGA